MYHTDPCSDDDSFAYTEDLPPPECRRSTRIRTKRKQPTRVTPLTRTKRVKPTPKKNQLPVTNPDTGCFATTDITLYVGACGGSVVKGHTPLPPRLVAFIETAHGSEWLGHHQWGQLLSNRAMVSDSILNAWVYSVVESAATSGVLLVPPFICQEIIDGNLEIASEWWAKIAPSEQRRIRTIAFLYPCEEDHYVVLLKSVDSADVFVVDSLTGASIWDGWDFVVSVMEHNMSLLSIDQRIYQLHEVNDTPQQKQGSNDCGVFTIYSVLITILYGFCPETGRPRYPPAYLQSARMRAALANDLAAYPSLAMDIGLRCSALAGIVGPPPLEVVVEHTHTPFYTTEH
jgi:hypothetical protein